MMFQVAQFFYPAPRAVETALRAAICAAVIAAVAWPQQQIAAVRFDPPQQPVAKEELGELVRIQPGAPLNRDQVRTTIEALYATGRYSDIRVETEGNDAVIHTAPAWFVGRVVVNGVHEPPNQAQLAGATGLRLGEPFYDDVLGPAEKALIETLRRNGFYEAALKSRVARDSATQQAIVEFDVTAGRRAKFARPVLNGAAPENVGGILNASRWRSYRGLLGWKTVTEARLNQGLERIRTYYANKNYLLNKVTLDRLDYSPANGRLTPILTIAPGPVIELRADDISTEDLRRLVPIYQEQSVDRDLLNEGSRNITEYLRSRGYFDAKVTYSIVESTPQRQLIQYDIARGDRHRLRAIHVGGNRYFDRSTITERMGITAATKIRYRNGRFSESLLAADTAAIRDLYISNGFRDVVVNTRIADVPASKDKSIEVYIDIQEGTQWLVEALHLEGIDPAYESALLSRAGAQPGQPYSESAVAIDRDQVLRAYYDSGYAEASFDWATQPGTDPKKVILTYTIREGAQKTVRGVLVSGLESSRPDLVTDRLSLRAGDVLSQAQLIDSQRRLYDLGVFARVDTALQNPDGAEQSKYVVMQFEEARRYSFNFGLGAEIARIGGGVGNLTAVTGKTGFSPRVTAAISRYNMFGVGHTATIQARVSNLQQRELLSYLAPHFVGTRGLSLTVTAYNDLSRDVQTFSARRQEVAAQLSQVLSRGLTAQFRYAFRRNSVDTNTIALNFPPDFAPIFARPGRVGILGGTLIRDHRDDPVDAHRGSYNSIDFGFASRNLGGETSFYRLLARNSTYHRVGRDIILARSTAFGVQRNLADGGYVTDIPLLERFYSGGGSSHRGFPENQAGPRDLTTGFPIGGSAQFFNNIELRFPLVGESLGAVLFHDAGNVYSSLNRISFRVTQRGLDDFNYMVHAAGIGFRIRTRAGPVRADFAYVPNRTSFFGFKGTREELISGGGQRINQKLNWFQFHISLGQAF